MSHFPRPAGGPKLEDLSAFINRKAQTVTSTTRQLKLDYGKGALVMMRIGPGLERQSQGSRIDGHQEISISSDLELGHVIAVSLDGKPLAKSSRILLQVMSEEQPTGYRTQSAADGMKPSSTSAAIRGW